MPPRSLPSDYRLLLADITLEQAAHLLGPEGPRLLAQSTLIPTAVDQAYVTDDLFRLMLPLARSDGKPTRRKVVVAIRPDGRSTSGLKLSCSQCSQPCIHQAAALRLIAEHKEELNLVPTETVPKIVPEPTDGELTTQAIAERAERSRVEFLEVKPLDPDHLWSDYVVTNRRNHREYRVALRGRSPGQSYCSCPDFRSNTLGTCKHILRAMAEVRDRYSEEEWQKPFIPDRIAVHLTYGPQIELYLQLPPDVSDNLRESSRPYREGAIADHDIAGLIRWVAHARSKGADVLLYPDAEQYIQQHLDLASLEATADAIMANPESHSLRTTLLRQDLLPYQLKGAAFVAKAGRAVLADEMGLGKTIQAIAAAELLALEVQIRSVLIVCPASLKSQWRSEIRRFTDRACQIVGGPSSTRGAQYTTDAFFTICNYEQVLRDHVHVGNRRWDFIILDEGQRIRNWETRTTQAIKTLRSRFALVLSGTPIENRLEDLFSIMQFIDDRRLSAAFRFFAHHRMVDDRGKFVGYRNLEELRARLAPVLLRRTRASVRAEIPPCTVDYVRIAPTAAQRNVHQKHLQQVSRLARKPRLNELDLLLLRKELLLCRMTADSPGLVDPQVVGESSKLDRLDEMLEELMLDESRKVLIFSEWTKMLDLIEPLLTARDITFVRLDGDVPQRDRAEIVEQFQLRPSTRVMLASNAASTGLNLQAANTVINVDLPWNPAVLQQRIARAHRMGQDEPVQVYVLVTEDTLEERLLVTLDAKQQLARAALDEASEIDEVWMTSASDALRTEIQQFLEPERLAALATEPASVSDEEARAESQPSEKPPAFPSRLSDSGRSPVSRERIARLRAHLQNSIEKDATGQVTVRIPLTGEQSLDDLALLLANWMAGEERE